MPVGARPRTQPPDVRREQILDAAKHVLVERGLRGTTVADVAEAAGVAKGTMYLYFASKDDVLAGLRARYQAEYARVIDANASGAVRERIRDLVVGLFEVGTKNHELHHVLFHEAGFSEADAFTGLRQRLTALVEEGVSTGEFDVVDVPLTVSFLLHGMHGSLVEALHSSRHRSRRRITDTVVALIDRALTP